MCYQVSYLHRLLCAKIGKIVSEMLLNPFGKFTTLVLPTEALISEYHYTVIGFTSEKWE